MTELEKLEAAFIKADDKAQTGDKVAAEDAKVFADRIRFLRANTESVEPQKPSDDYAPDSRDIATPFMKGATLGASDEAIGGVAALYMKMHDLVTGGMGKSGVTGEEAPSFKQNYETARDQVRADQDAFQEANPKADLAAQLAGGVLTGGYLGSKAFSTNLARSFPKLALPTIGAAEGAAFGFNEGEGLEDSLKGAGKQGAISAIATPAVAKVLNVVGKGAQKGLAKLLHKEGSKTLDDLRLESKSFYKKAEESGIKVRPGTFKKFKKDLITELEAGGISVSKTPRTPAERGINNTIRRMAASDEPTYQDLAAMKTLLDNAKASSDGAVSDAAYIVSNKLDDFIENLTPGRISAGSAEDLGTNIKEAKSYWNRLQQGKTLEKYRKRAELAESTIADGDFDKAIRATNRSIVDPVVAKKSRGMDKEVISNLEDMIKGSGAKNLARWGAAMDPGQATRRGISPALGSGMLAIAGASQLGTAGLAVGLLPLIPPILGRALKGMANKITRAEYTRIQQAVINKDHPAVEEIIARLYAKYKPAVSGIAAGASGAASEEAETKIQDMMQ